DTVCKTSFTIAGQGDWSIDQATGVPTFVADPSASVGTKTAVTFRVTDAVGATATATLTPVVPPDPTMTPDSGSAGLDTNQMFSVLVNDNPGTGTTFDVTSVRLCGHGETPPRCSLTTFLVADQGTYSVSSTGVVTFDPLPDFVGSATAVSYQVTDSMGRTTSSTITPTVTSVPPSATPDTVLVARGGTARFRSMTSGDGLVARVAGGASIVPSSACIVDPSTQSCGSTPVVIAGEGTFTIDVLTGIVTFSADSSAVTGPQSSITYEVTDRSGFTVRSTLTPTVVAPPVASPDASHGVQGASQTIDLLSNDTPGALEVPLLPTSVRLCALIDTPPACVQTTVEVAGEGRYTVNTATGLITFTPVPSFAGAATPLSYVVSDLLGQRRSSSISVTVTSSGSTNAGGSTPSGRLPTTGTDVLNFLPWALALVIFGRRLMRVRLS
ncbi:MAG: hypothetical protein ACKOHN_09155, partial [Actinomycetota bacterium]